MSEQYRVDDRAGTKRYYRVADATEFEPLPEKQKELWIGEHGIKPADHVEFTLDDGRKVLVEVNKAWILGKQNAETQAKQISYYLNKGQARLVAEPKPSTNSGAGEGETTQAAAASGLKTDNANIARKIANLRERLPAESTVAAYLRARGLDPDALPPSVRGRPQTFKGSQSSLVGLAFDAADKVVGMAEVFVVHGGTKAPPKKGDDGGWIIPESSKRTTGLINGYPIKLQHAGTGMGHCPLILCEGLETGLSIYQSMPDREVWCVTGVKHFAAAPVPPNADVIICRDGDGGDSRAAGDLSAAIGALQAKGHRVLVTQTPPGEDANSMLQASGPDAVRKLIADAVVAEHVEVPKADAALGDAPQQISMTSVFPFNPAATPLRDWLMPGLLERGKVTLIAGHPGVMKSLKALYLALSCVLQHSFGPWMPCPPRFGSQSLKVVMVNAEDDLDEIRRRTEAALKTAFADAHPDDADLQGRLMFVETEVFKMVACDNSGLPKTTEMYNSFLQQLAALKPDLIVLDPLVELSVGIDENSAAMAEVMAAIRRIARKLECAVLVLHHFAKGGTAKDQNAYRGSSSIGGSVRYTLNIARADDDDVETYRIPPADRVDYIKVGQQKASYARPGSEHWFRAERCDLANGEESVALAPFYPETIPITLEVVNAVLDDLERGRGKGPDGPMLWSHKPKTADDMRATAMMRDRHKLTPDQAARLQMDLLAAGLIKAGVEYKTKHYKVAKGIAVVKRPTCWPINADVPFTKPN